MANGITLQAERQKLYEAVSKDGIDELVIGLFLVFAALLACFDLGHILFLYIMIVPAGVHLKKKITYPRIGYFKIGSKKKPDLRDYYGFGLSSFLVLMIASIIVIALKNKLPDSIQHYTFLGIGGLAIVYVYLLISRTGVKRYYAYLGLMIACYLHAVIMNYTFDNGKDFLIEKLAAYSLVIGTVMTLTGLILLFRFIRMNPVEEMDND